MEASVKELSPDLWWDGLTAEERETVWEAAQVAYDLFDGEVVEFEYTPKGFAMNMWSDVRTSWDEPGRSGGRAWPGHETPERWWASRPVQQKDAERQHGAALLNLRVRRDQILQVRRTGRLLRAKLRRYIGGIACLN